MPIRFKVDIIALLREKGFTSYKMRHGGERVINEAALQRLRNGKMISWEQLSNICRVLDCQPGDLLEYVPDENKSED